MIFLKSEKCTNSANGFLLRKCKKKKTNKYIYFFQILKKWGGWGEASPMKIISEGRNFPGTKKNIEGAMEMKNLEGDRKKLKGTKKTEGDFYAIYGRLE